MAILNIQENEPGQSGVDPRILRIETNDSVATVTTAGYLTDPVKKGLLSLKESDMVLVVTQESASAAKEVGWFEVSESSGAWSLVPPANPGDVVLPTVANRLAHFTNTTGTLSGAAADVTNLGDLTLGASGTEGLLNLFPATALKGSLIIKAVNNTGNDSVTISNAAHGQATVISIPDGGQATAEFIISDSAGVQHITSGALQLDVGDLSVGSDANAAKIVVYPTTTASGTLEIAAVDSSTDSAVTISNADHGQASVVSIPDGGQATANFIISESTGTQAIASGNLQVSTGNIVAGSDANAGILESHPTTTNSGTLQLAAVDSSTDSAVTISNADFGQASVISIPDPGAATANFLLDAGSSNILAWQQFVGLESVLSFGTGTWTITRIAQGNYVSRHSAADETSVIGIDITPMIRVAAGKGFRLDSFDVIYSIETANMDAHTVTLDRIDYVDASTVTVNSIAITGTLSIVDAGVTLPYVTNVAVDAPAFDVTADSKYVIEVTADNGATTEYDFYGIMLRFSETVA